MKSSCQSLFSKSIISCLDENSPVLCSITASSTVSRSRRVEWSFIDPPNQQQRELMVLIAVIATV